MEPSTVQPTKPTKSLTNTLTFFRQVELLELGPLLVELHLQLLFELEELSPLLLQVPDALLEKPCHSDKTLLTTLLGIKGPIRTTTLC